MAKKQFKAESKKLLDLMINSIYTNPDIFLRELISNASDAMDKLYFQSLTDKTISCKRDNLVIWITPDKDKRTLTIKDNGIGMSKDELEDNLGTIAKSGSELFKENAGKDKETSIIGQFGVGFYSAFMVASKVEVRSRSINDDKTYLWESSGVSGYSVEETDSGDVGTSITLYLKDSTDEIDTDKYLDVYNLEQLVKKYSDYIKYPIKMMVEHVENVDNKDKDKNKEKEKKVTFEEKTLNSMVPIWKKKKSEVTDDEFNDFYTDKFYDYEKPLKVIRSDVEGLTSYQALLYIPSHAPYNYYTKEYEKGLQLYSKGVMIMEKCDSLLPDYFSFVKGLVDSEDIALNISRETMQQNNQVRLIAKNIENKIKNELETMLRDERDNYEKFYQAFGMQLKYGIYSSYGMNKEKLQDLLLFKSSKEDKYVTLDEYVSRISNDEKNIYYASGESIDKIKMLPQVEMLIDKGYEVLYLTEYLDEFVIKLLGTYKEKNFINAMDKSLDMESDTEKDEIKKINEDNKDILKVMKDALGDSVKEVRFTNKLMNHPVCLTTSGEISIEMEKIINNMAQDSDKVKADTILEINANHDITKKIKELYNQDNKDEVINYTKILYNQARLISGLSVENPNELTNMICELLSK